MFFRGSGGGLDAVDRLDGERVANADFGKDRPAGFVRHAGSRGFYRRRDGSLDRVGVTFAPSFFQDCENVPGVRFAVGLVLAVLAKRPPDLLDRPAFHFVTPVSEDHGTGPVGHVVTPVAMQNRLDDLRKLGPMVSELLRLQ